MYSLTIAARNCQSTLTHLSIADYNAFLTLTMLEYETGLIKEKSPSEPIRFTICRHYFYANTQKEEDHDNM